MLDRRAAIPTRAAVVLALAWVCAAPTSALAHKLTLFAAVEGEKITGEAFFRGGTPVRGATVAVFDARGTKLAEVQTDAQGKFHYLPKSRAEHRLVLNAGDGHSAEYTISAAEMPAALAAAPTDGQTAPAAPQGRATIESEAGTISPKREPSVGADAQPSAPSADPPRAALSPSTSSGGPTQAAETAIIARLEGVERQLVELRKDLVRSQEDVRLHDVLGGIGFIAGLGGTAFYFLGVRRRDKALAATDRP